jgi:hypothetical protein
MILLSRFSGVPDANSALRIISPSPKNLMIGTEADPTSMRFFLNGSDPVRVRRRHYIFQVNV